MFYPVADAHCDFLYGMVNYRYDIACPTGQQVTSLENFEKGHVALQFLACLIDTSLKLSPLHQCMNMIGAFDRMIDAHPDRLVRFSKDFDPLASDKTACQLTIEGGEAIEGDPTLLEPLHALGIRAMTLTWNESNELSGAAMQRNRRGLTDLGYETIHEMNRLGIAIDLAHLSDAGIDDVLSETKQPVFASHSNARQVFEAKRSLCDDHIRAIAEGGGVVCVNFYNKQLTDKKVACLSDIVRQITYMVKVAGIDHVGLGSDFDGMPLYPEGMPNASGYPELLSMLRAEGMTDADIHKISYLNLANYMKSFV